jgi:hypothetical protein
MPIVPCSDELMGQAEILVRSVFNRSYTLTGGVEYAGSSLIL